jgi:hypothetical protein
MHGDAARRGFTRGVVASGLAYFLAVFLVLFPKGGFKIGTVPFTWGYGVLGISICLGALFLPSKDPFRVQRGTAAAFLCLVPLQLLMLYSLAANGIGDFGFALSDIVIFFVLPIAFLAIFSQFLPRISLDGLLSFVRWMVFLAAAYGIFLFVWKIFTGNYIEIPYLTVNVGDLGTLDDKFNSRPGGLFKLISTYNNGNQYGVATLLLLPLFDLYETNWFRRLVVRGALILTLSRTVWAGLLIYEVLDVIRLAIFDSSSRKSSMRRAVKARLFRLVSISVIVVALSILFSVLSEVSFLFDPTLGGRTEYLDTLGRFTVLPSIPLNNFLEIIYYSAISMFGIGGLFAIVLLFCSPLLLAGVFKELRRSSIQVAALEGLVLYIALAGMDGALNYIPTMTFYWFLWMLFLYTPDQNNDGRKVELARMQAPRIAAHSRA